MFLEASVSVVSHSFRRDMSLRVTHLHCGWTNSHSTPVGVGRYQGSRTIALADFYKHTTPAEWRAGLSQQLGIR